MARTTSTLELPIDQHRHGITGKIRAHQDVILKGDTILSRVRSMTTGCQGTDLEYCHDQKHAVPCLDSVWIQIPNTTVIFLHGTLTDHNTVWHGTGFGCFALAWQVNHAHCKGASATLLQRACVEEHGLRRHHERARKHLARDRVTRSSGTQHEKKNTLKLSLQASECCS